MALVVFTGGARSGKSQAAERLARRRGETTGGVWVVAFGRAEHADPEFEQRVARHRADRPEGFATIEASDSDGWQVNVPQDALVVIDCLGTLLGRVMEEVWDRRSASARLLEAPADVLFDGFEAQVVGCFEPNLQWIAQRTGDTIVITNEVGDGVVPTYATGRLFRDILGRANRTLVDLADAAYLVVAGRLLDLHSMPRDARWPRD